MFRIEYSDFDFASLSLKKLIESRDRHAASVPQVQALGPDLGDAGCDADAGRSDSGARRYRLWES